MKQFLPLLLIFSSSIAIADRCLISNDGGNFKESICNIDLTGGGGNWISLKVTNLGKEYFILKQDQQPFLTTKEEDLYSAEVDRYKTKTYFLDKNKNKVSEEIAKWDCYKIPKTHQSICTGRAQ